MIDETAPKQSMWVGGYENYVRRSSLSQGQSGTRHRNALKGVKFSHFRIEKSTRYFTKFSIVVRGISPEFGFNSDSIPTWFRLDSDLIPTWLWLDSNLTPTWFWFGSDLILTRFWLNADLIPTWFRLDSDSIPTRIWLNSDFILTQSKTDPYFIPTQSLLHPNLIPTLSRLGFRSNQTPFNSFHFAVYQSFTWIETSRNSCRSYLSRWKTGIVITQIIRNCLRHLLSELICDVLYIFQFASTS